MDVVSNLFELMQACPVLRNLDAIVPLMAVATSAESKTTRGAFPPSSRDNRLTVPAQRAMISLPTPVEPVKESLRTRGLSHRWFPTTDACARLVGNTLNTPGGNLACSLS